MKKFKWTKTKLPGQEQFQPKEWGRKGGYKIQLSIWTKKKTKGKGVDEMISQNFQVEIRSSRAWYSWILTNSMRFYNLCKPHFGDFPKVWKHSSKSPRLFTSSFKNSGIQLLSNACKGSWIADVYSWTWPFCVPPSHASTQVLPCFLSDLCALTDLPSRVGGKNKSRKDWIKQKPPIFIQGQKTPDLD